MVSDHVYKASIGLRLATAFGWCGAEPIVDLAGHLVSGKDNQVERRAAIFWCHALDRRSEQSLADALALVRWINMEVVEKRAEARMEVRHEAGEADKRSCLTSDNDDRRIPGVDA